MSSEEQDADKARYPTLGGLYIAVFNTSEYDRTVGRRAVIDRYGVDAWKRKCLPFMRTGVMEIFSHPETPELLLFARVAADKAEARAQKQKAKVQS